MVLPWDELNNLRTRVESLAIEYEWDGVKRKRIRPRECVDLILEWLIDCYLLGDQFVRQSFADPGFGEMDTDEMYGTIYKKVAGKNFAERVSEYASSGDIDSIMRVAETDATRVFTESEERTAARLGARWKTWNTMLDNRVRTGHEYLEGVTVPIGAYFYTEGDQALHPGDFNSADLNVNCRCFLTFS